ncbi:MAG: hypothetical protein ACRDT0_11245 [Pseudonocardiaceae bacterium]
MDGEGELYVDRASLTAAAGRADAVAAAVPRTGDEPAGQILDAAAPHRGMLTAFAMVNAVERWSQQMTVLGQDVGGVATRLRDTVAEYDDREKSNEELFGGPNVPV